ncbi:hypothetical protein VPHK436_0013 [Vibrio phage K436]
MNTFNNAIADITRYYRINAAVKGDTARMQVPAQDALAIFKWVREHTTGTWWTAECDIINVYSNEYDFVISKRSGNITITDMMLPGTMAGAVAAERSCTVPPVMAAPYGRGRVYPRTPQHAMIAAYGASPANVAHALDTQRTNEMVECVKLGFTYELYCDYMAQRVSDEYRDVLTVTWQEYKAQVQAFGKQVADLDSAL